MPLFNCDDVVTLKLLCYLPCSEKISSLVKHLYWIFFLLEKVLIACHPLSLLRTPLMVFGQLNDKGLLYIFTGTTKCKYVIRFQNQVNKNNTTEGKIT